MKARVRFSKKGNLEYIGHLDMMRFFQKAIKRADLPVAYTEGFNPHQIMTFGSPLGLGMTSSAEYMDIELLDAIDLDEAKAKLNDNMVVGIEIISINYLPDKAANVMSVTSAARYRVILSDAFLSKCIGTCDFASEIPHFLSQDKCIYHKKTKRSEVELDILPLIYEFTYIEDAFYITCSSGSNDNIKPEVIINALFDYMKIEAVADRTDLLIERLELYERDKNSLVALDKKPG